MILLMDYTSEIKNLYRQVLDREADNEGIQTYTKFLQKRTLEDLKKILYNSFEYRNKGSKVASPDRLGSIVPKPVVKKKYIMKPKKNYIVGIFMHVGNIEIMNEMKKVIITIQSCCKCEIFISSLFPLSPNDFPMNMRNSHIILCENIGMDIGGFTKSIEYVRDNEIKLDFILKLHTKSMKEWRDKLYLPLCETSDIVNNILWMFESDEMVGVIGSPENICSIQNANKIIITQKLRDLNLNDRFIFYDVDIENINSYEFDPQFYISYHADMVRNKVKLEDAISHWEQDGKFEHERVISNDMIKTIGNNMQYVGGTMFWMRYSVMNLFQDYLIKDYVNFEKGRIINRKETHTHSWEYLFGIIPQIHGYKINRSISYESQDIAVFIPEVPETPVCGGSRTIQIWINELCKKFNVKLFVCASTDNVIYDISDMSKRIHNFNELEYNYTVHNIDEFDNSTEYLTLISTGWQTTDIVENANNCKNKIHIIQDYECDFFDDKNFYRRAEQTYLKPDAYDFRVCAGKYMSYFLYKKYDLIVNPIQFGINKSVFNFQKKRRNPKIVLTYMPSKKRRNPTLVKKIYYVLKTKYEVVVIGDDHTDLPSKSYSQQELSQLYNESKIGIVFSMSNPSRMGIEMGACGLPVIEYDTKSNKFDVPNCVFRVSDIENVENIVEHLMKMSYQEYQHIVEKTSTLCSSRDIAEEKNTFLELFSSLL
jgi:hypothetical protein